jgi:NAD(P)H-hydrate repair Nnr-like enzyme with NAD(P)H-hydrate epimerase domain
MASPPRALSRLENQQLDENAIRLGMPSLLLMENAGLGLAHVVTNELSERDMGPPASVVIVVGPGNNGGDGLVVGRHLALRGYTPLYAYCGSRCGAHPVHSMCIPYGWADAAAAGPKPSARAMPASTSPS